MLIRYRQAHWQRVLRCLADAIEQCMDRIGAVAGRTL
jgi:hypothetical protein